MKENKQKEITISILTVIPLLFTVALYSSLPDKIPMHWNINGQIDNWGSRLSAFYMPFTIIGLSLLLKYIPKIDPNKRNFDRFKDTYSTIRLIFVVFMGFMTGLTLYAAFNPSGVHINIIIPVAIGIFFALTGNFMPKFKQNYFAGIRTPWTLANEEVWTKTHRLGGVIWFWGGLIIAISAFIVPNNIFFIVMIFTISILAIVPCIYSYILFRNITKTDI